MNKQFVILCLALLAPPSRGQVLHATAPLPTFEVATIKPNDPKVMFMIKAPGAEETYRTAGTARRLIGQAYAPFASSDKIILGGPAWIDKDIFRIEAKLPLDLFQRMQTMPPEERRRQSALLMQSLLAERFMLKVHFEQRILPVYELVVAKDGLKMKKSADDDFTPGGGGMVLLKDGIRLDSRNATMEDFAATLQAAAIDRIVVDRTGVTGRYSVRINFSSENTVFAGHIPDQSPSENPAPSLYTALAELGLKLQPAKDPVEVVLIDSIDPPSGN